VNGQSTGVDWVLDARGWWQAGCVGEARALVFWEELEKKRNRDDGMVVRRSRELGGGRLISRQPQREDDANTCLIMCRGVAGGRAAKQRRGLAALQCLIIHGQVTDASTHSRPLRRQSGGARERESKLPPPVEFSRVDEASCMTICRGSTTGGGGGEPRDIERRATNLAVQRAGRVKQGCQGRGRRIGENKGLLP